MMEIITDINMEPETERDLQYKDAMQYYDGIFESGLHTYTRFLSEEDIELFYSALCKLRFHKLDSVQQDLIKSILVDRYGVPEDIRKSLIMILNDIILNVDNDEAYYFKI